MKNILIVGASRGIGYSTCDVLQTNTHLYTISRGPMPTSINTIHFQLDVTKDPIDALVGDLPDALDGLVYCPGSINLKSFNRLSKEDFYQDFEQNVFGAIRLLQACYPKLKKSGNASVVLFSTVASKIGMPFHASIAVSKSAIEGLTKSLAAEWASNNIRVNTIALSLTDTPLASSLLNTPEKKEASAKRHPLNQIGDPTDIAHFVSLLLNDQSRFMTGQIICIDGGIGSLK